MIRPLNLPKAELDLQRKGTEVYVWCIVRKKRLLLTPEEWVRQHVIHYLINEQAIPLGLIASEYPLKYHEREKRADIIVFDKSAKPVMVIECKATDVSLNQETLFQIAQYTHVLRSPFIMLTNGLDHVYASLNDGALKYHQEFPSLEL
jgi:type I site-specific restriction endonuclease